MYMHAPSVRTSIHSYMHTNILMDIRALTRRVFLVNFLSSVQAMWVWWTSWDRCSWYVDCFVVGLAIAFSLKYGRS